MRRLLYHEMFLPQNIFERPRERQYPKQLVTDPLYRSESIDDIIGSASSIASAMPW